MKNLKISVFKDLLKTKDVPYIVPLEKVFERIRRGTSKGLVEQIRSSKDKNQRDALKKNLPCVFSFKNSSL